MRGVWLIVLGILKVNCFRNVRNFVMRGIVMRVKSMRRSKDKTLRWLFLTLVLGLEVFSGLLVVTVFKDNIAGFNVAGKELEALNLSSSSVEGLIYNYAKYGLGTIMVVLIVALLSLLILYMLQAVDSSDLRDRVRELEKRVEEAET